jgi:hypothetical protein
VFKLQILNTTLNHKFYNFIEEEEKCVKSNLHKVFFFPFIELHKRFIIVMTNSDVNNKHVARLSVH